MLVPRAHRGVSSSREMFDRRPCTCVATFVGSPPFAISGRGQAQGDAAPSRSVAGRAGTIKHGHSSLVPFLEQLRTAVAPQQWVARVPRALAGAARAAVSPPVTLDVRAHEMRMQAEFGDAAHVAE